MQSCPHPRHALTSVGLCAAQVKYNDMPDVSKATPDFKEKSLQQICRQICGSAKSMGIEIKREL